MKKIIITGSNKGIGFGLLKALSSRPYEIIMACRNLQLAKNAISTKLELEQQKKVIPMELDLNFPDSIKNFTKEIQQKFPKIDILVNNAGIKREKSDEQTIKEVLRTNFFGTVELTEQLLPSIRDFGKILIIGSTMGKYKLALKSEDLKKQFDQTKTNEDMYKLVDKYLESIKNKTVEQAGFASSSYCVSKMCIDVYAQNLGRRMIEKNIQVYACCPGNTKTDLGGPKARFTVDQAIVTPLYLIDLPEVIKTELQGKLFYNKKVFSLWDPR